MGARERLRWRGSRTTAAVSAAVSDHVELVVENASLSDFHRRLAAGADPDAQRWLGWDDETMRLARGALAAGCLRQLRRPAKPFAWPKTWSLITMSTGQEFVASAVVYRYGSHSDREPLGPASLEWQVGLIVAPTWRGRGLGARLFAMAATHAHGVLGLETVGAGCDPSNHPAIRALTRAKFVPGSGPGRRQLPDGRVVPAAWFQRSRDLV